MIRFGIVGLGIRGNKYLEMFMNQKIEGAKLTAVTTASMEKVTREE